MNKQILQQAQIKAISKAAAEKFMTWELPQDFYPDNYIEFDKKYALERGIWPTGTNLMHVGQAQAMFEHCLAEALRSALAQQGEPVAPEQVEAAWRAGWAACRDAEYVGKEAEDEAWGMSQTCANADWENAGAAPAAQPDTWTDDGGWTFPIEGGSNV